LAARSATVNPSGETARGEHSGEGGAGAGLVDLDAADRLFYAASAN